MHHATMEDTTLNSTIPEKKNIISSKMDSSDNESPCLLIETKESLKKKIAITKKSLYHWEEEQSSAAYMYRCSLKDKAEFKASGQVIPKDLYDRLQKHEDGLYEELKICNRNVAYDQQWLTVLEKKLKNNDFSVKSPPPLPHWK